MRESRIPTQYAVVCLGTSRPEGANPCNNGGLLYLTEQEYDRQRNNPTDLWRCPRCGGLADWDDDNYENYLNDDQSAYLD